MTKTRREEAETRCPPSHKSGKTRKEFKAEYNPDEEVSYLRDEIKRLGRFHEQELKEQGSLKTLFRDMKECIQELEAPKIRYRKPKTTHVKMPIVHVSHWCDWHHGAVQDPDEIEGFNEFNPDLTRTRLFNCENDQIDWCELHRKSYTINERRNLITGDLISGGIHPELLWTNAFPEPVQAIKVGELLAELIVTQSPHYEKVVVDFVTTDNHGRLTKKPQCNEAGINCWGYVIGHYAKERLRGINNVEFNIYPVIQQTVDVGGQRYLLMHGDRVRGWAGFPYYGIQRKVGREATKRMKKNLGKFDKIIMGHFHAPLTHPDYWIGGSVSGTTSYDHSEGRDASPQQCSWMVHPKHGEFDRTDWNLRDK